MSIGYACVHIGDQQTRLRRVTLQNASSEQLRTVIAHNLNALLYILQYNRRNNIHLFRISSDIIPFGSHPANQLHWMDEFAEPLTTIQKMIEEEHMRVSMHPGQYTVINSPRKDVVERAILDLQYHFDFLSSITYQIHHKIILHIGGAYGDKGTAKRRFIQVFQSLPKPIQQRISIENDDKNYHIQDVLDISKTLHIPVVFDNLHHALNPPALDHPISHWIELARSTWKLQDGSQKIHYSQPLPNGRSGAHSKHIALDSFTAFYNQLPDPSIDIMLEVKDKNLSAVKCILATSQAKSIQSLEREWARYKYYVLSKSASIYQSIRTLLKDKSNVPIRSFYQYIESARDLPFDLGAQINALQHMWGYVNQNATIQQIKRFHKGVDLLSANPASKQARNVLLQCAQQQNQKYLFDSLYFYIDDE